MDMEAALNRFMGDRDFLWEQVELFMATIPEELKALRQEASEGDPEGLTRKAHALKGAAASLSINGLSAAALEIETRGRNKNLTDLEPVLARLEDEAAQFRRYVTASANRKKVNAV